MNFKSKCKTKYNAIIFDVDGTLIDGTIGILSSLKKTFKRLNLEMPIKEQLLQFIGPPLQFTCEKQFNMSESEADDFAKIFRDYYCTGDIYKAQLYPDIYKLMEFLKMYKIKLGIATYKREDLVIELIKHFELYKFMDSICGADNENTLKKIDILNKSINQLSINTSNALFIGDSYHDALAANGLGVDFLGVTYGFGFKTKAEIQEYNPVFCADSVKEIIEYLKGN